MSDFFYISKAFDKIWHKGPPFKLDGYTLVWIESYLDDRVQREVLDGFYSSFKPLSASVPRLGLVMLLMNHLHTVI